MATYTTNYNLEKPEASDPFGDFRESYNDNLDIIDANLGGGGGGSDDYTLTEQVVGTWLGKPLYQITIPFSGINLSANTYYGINIGSYVIDYETMFLMKDMSYYMVNNVERLFTEMTLEPPTVYIKTNVARTNISGHFVVRYTKTTD